MAFFAVFLVLLAGVSALLTGPGTSRANYQWIHGFYDEPDHSLDGVYIGPSNAYCSWIAPLAWERYGIAVWPFTSSRQPFLIAKDLVEEARKTQPDAVYIVTVGSVDPLPESEAAIHDLIDFMPLSAQKLRIIQKLCDSLGYDASERTEFYFPLIRFHSHWSDLEQIDFHLTNNGMKGASTRNVFFKNITDVSADLRTTEMQGEISQDMERALEELLTYCESEQVKLLLVIPPMAEVDLEELAQLNRIKRLCEDRGFPVVDERQAMAEIGLDPQCDYYNNIHTNIHGAIKLTDYLARYLTAHYDMRDKRGVPGYESWDKSYGLYRARADSYTMDFEWDGSLRDTTLSAPKLSEIKVSGSSMTVFWQTVSGADGYRVYRKPVTDDKNSPGWELIAEVDRDTLQYRDTGLETNAAYCYTAVAFQKENGAYRYGQVSYTGITGTALMRSPGGLTLSGSANDLTLTWDAIKSADGYEVSRGILADTADRIETDVGEETCYRDAHMLTEVPYGYQVRGYRYDAAGEKIYGSWSAEAVWMPERTGPDVTVQLVDGIPALSWKEMAGISGYSVFRRAEKGGWELVADRLSPQCTAMEDLTVKKGTEYTYRVEAYLQYAGETYRYPGQTVGITAEKTGMALPTTEILFCGQVGDRIFLEWTPTESAAMYCLYRYQWEEEAGAWEEKPPVTVTNPYCWQTPSESGRFRYLVRALCDFGDFTLLGAYDENQWRIVEYRKSE